MRVGEDYANLIFDEPDCLLQLARNALQQEVSEHKHIEHCYGFFFGLLEHFVALLDECKLLERRTSFKAFSHFCEVLCASHGRLLQQASHGYKFISLSILGAENILQHRVIWFIC